MYKALLIPIEDRAKVIKAAKDRIAACEKEEKAAAK